MKNLMKMNQQELTTFIQDKKRELGDSVRIFAHNFTSDDLLELSDVVGDSSKLAYESTNSTSDFLLFVSAKFFTEAACILAPNKRIIQSNMKADCPLSYTIDEKITRKVFQALKEKNKARQIIPMSYFTASSELKCFCGENDGTVCTASNSLSLIKHYLDQDISVFFTPMNNIAFNVIKKLQLPDEDIAVLDESTDLAEIPANKKIYVWNVGCYVHSAFTTEDVQHIRNKYKNDNIKVVAHLECLPDVISQCDYAYFTDGIHDLIKNAPSGSCWAIATVYNYVQRIADEFPDKKIVAIRPDLICEDMVVTNLLHLAESLQSISDYKTGKGKLKYEISIPEYTKKYAKKALDKMFWLNKKHSIEEEVVYF